MSTGRTPAVVFLGGVLVCTYFLWLSGSGLRAGLTHDDLLNLWRAHVETTLPTLVADFFVFFRFSSALRPLGELFYYAFFVAFQFDPLPYRVARYAALCANAFLTYALARRLSGSRHVGGASALLHCYHVGFWPMYLNTGMCFDIFCFFFYYAILVYYVRVRQERRYPRAREILLIAMLYLCALNSKEMAATLPAMIAIYELLFHRPDLAWRNYRQALTTLVTGLMAVAFVAGRLAGPQSIRHGGGYALDISIGAYLDLFRRSFNEIFYQQDLFGIVTATALLAAMLIAGLVTRDRTLLFAWFLTTIGVLPVAFIAPRPMYAIYLPALGLALYAATTLVRLGALVQALGRYRERTGQVVLFVGLALLLGSAHADIAAKSQYFEKMTPQYRDIQSVIRQFRRLHPNLPTGSRVLLLKNPFEGQAMEVLSPEFIVSLLYGRDVDVDRAFAMDRELTPAEIANYDFVFTAEGSRIVEVTR